MCLDTWKYCEYKGLFSAQYFAGKKQQRLFNEILAQNHNNYAKIKARLSLHKIICKNHN